MGGKPLELCKETILVSTAPTSSLLELVIHCCHGVFNYLEICGESLEKMKMAKTDSLGDLSGVVQLSRAGRERERAMN